MTWPERLDLMLAILASIPYRWLLTGVIIGMVLAATIVIAAVLVTGGDDPRRRDVYYENHIRE